MKIKEKNLKEFIKEIAATRSEEIGCDTCYEELHRFTDMLKDGKDPAKVMPLVQNHLEMCNGCGEEFAALLQALEAASSA